MTSTAARPQPESSVSAATFSYAQAAKGRMASATVSTAQSSQTPSGTNTPSKDSSITVETTAVGLNGTGSESDNKSSTHGDNSSRNEKARGLESEFETNLAAPITSTPSSPSFGTASTSTLSKGDEAGSVAHSVSDSPWDKQSVSEPAEGKSADSGERKGRKKTKKEKHAEKEAEQEKEKEEIKPEILVAAPPPSVNIWTQRKEAQAAKVVKVTPAALDNRSAPEATANGVESTSSSKQARKAKAIAVDEPINQNGSMKEAAPAKGPKKGLDSASRSKDDSNARRTATRGTRVADKEEKAAVAQAPPPVEDAISWPTPETALEEEKRKAQEKAEKDEKDENTSNKQPRQKEKWVPVPYTPSVTFNTPLPVRGGRGGRGLGARGGREPGGRGGHTPNGSIGGDKSSAPSGMESRERGRDAGTSGRAASLPPNASKRSSGDNPSNGRDQRKQSTAVTSEKSKPEGASSAAKNEASSGAQNQRSQPSAQDVGTQDARAQGAEGTKQNRNEHTNGFINDAPPFGRTSGPERRSEPNIRTGDFSKDLNNTQSRERGDGRMDRGRGAFRGVRGSHNNFTNGQQHAQQFPNGAVAQSQNGYGMRPNAGPYSPPLQQPQYATQYPPTPGGRNGRGGPSRAQSIPNGSSVYGRSPSYPPNGASMAPLQTTGPGYEYPGNVGSMSAVPFNPYVDQYSVLAMVVMQLEYYFSIDNLCKDVFLRKHMDDQGFVFLSFIASFKRIQSLNQEFELLRFACQESEVIEIVMGEDGVDRIRRRDGWESWTLAREDRDPAAQHSGPERFYVQMANSHRAQQHMGQRIVSPIQHGPPPPFYPANGTHAPHAAAGPVATLTNGVDAIPVPITFQNVNEEILNASTTFNHNPQENGTLPQSGSPLSAAVPDFQPNDYLGAETTFTDEEVDKLNVVYTQSSRGEPKPNVPFHYASRTFSQGSIDGESIEALQEQEKRSGRPMTNGGSGGPELPPRSPESLRRSRSPFSLGSPTKLVFGNAPPVMWSKDPKVQGRLSAPTKEESYNVICARALRHRESSLPGETGSDMRLLYQFWTHFLVRNFNPRMYEEFRRCAFDDAYNRKAMFGMNSLITYYNEVLNSKKKTIAEIFAKHYVDLVKGEDRTGDRPAFQKLRASWRNGALDLKSRKKISGFVDEQLRDELEK